MMRNRLLALAERRAQLAARAKAEREALSRLIAPADGAATAVAALLGLARRAADAAGRHPLVVVAGVALLAVLRPRRTFAWLARGWSLWRLARGAQGWWRRFSAAAGDPSAGAR
jgi:hypothetical protein